MLARFDERKDSVLELLQRDCLNFRRAIQKVDDSSWPYFLGLSLKQFPKGCCGHASHLLCEYLIVLYDLDISYVCGVRTRGQNEQSHAWLEIESEGILIDITRDQFNYFRNFEVIKFGHPWYRQFRTEKKQKGSFKHIDPNDDYFEAYELILSAM